MKNLHLLPTDKPSRLHFDGKLFLSPNYQDSKTINSTVEGRNIYITSDEEIKEGDWGLSKLNEVILFGRSYNEKFYNKIILTTDQDLIADGVQAIDDTFLEWFVKNPSCEFVKIVDDVECLPMPNIHINNHIYKIIIPQEDKIDLAKLRTTQFSLEMATNAIQEAKQETLEEAAENYSQGWGENDDVKSFIAGAKWMLEKLQDFDTWKEWKDINFKSE